MAKYTPDTIRKGLASRPVLWKGRKDGMTQILTGKDTSVIKGRLRLCSTEKLREAVMAPVPVLIELQDDGSDPFTRSVFAALTKGLGKEEKEKAYKAWVESHSQSGIVTLMAMVDFLALCEKAKDQARGSVTLSSDVSCGTAGRGEEAEAFGLPGGKMSIRLTEIDDCSIMPWNEYARLLRKSGNRKSLSHSEVSSLEGPDSERAAESDNLTESEGSEVLLLWR